MSLRKGVVQSTRSEWIATSLLQAFLFASTVQKAPETTHDGEKLAAERMKAVSAGEFP